MSDGTSPTREQVLKRLMLAHQAYYDVFEQYPFEGRTFPVYAEFHTHGEQYVLVKRAKLWEVDSHEYLFFESVARLTVDELQELVDYMKERGIKKVNPVPNHMSSNLSLVIVADEIDDEAEQLLRKTRYRKNFAWGIRGWSDLRIGAVDLARGVVLTNPAGKEMKPVLESNAFSPQDG